jgi:hypothetical protein
MTLEAIYFVSQTISSVAVVASLIYLALQTRQTARNQRALMHQARVDTMLQEFAWGTDATMMPAILKHTMPADTPDTDAERYLSYFRLLFAHCEEAFQQWREGMIDTRRWRSTERNMRFVLAFPGNRAAWKLLRVAFDADFAAVVDALCTNAAHERPPSGGSVWKQLADQELAAVSPQPSATPA